MNPLSINLLDWDKLKIFYLLSQHPTLVQAGRHMGFHQSHLTRIVDQLEKEIRVKLITRGRRGIQLLPEGKTLQGMIAPFFDQIAHYESRVRSQNSDLEGTLRVFVSPLYPVTWLLQHTPVFLAQHPKIRFQVQTSPDQPHDCSLEPYVSSQREKIQSLLLRLTYGLYVSKSYLETYGPVSSPKGHRRIVLRTPLNLCQGWPEDLPAVEITHEFTTAQDVFWAAQQGMGMAALPEAQASEDPDLVALPLKIKPVSVDLYYSYSSLYQHVNRMTAYGDYLSQVFDPSKIYEPEERKAA